MRFDQRCLGLSVLLICGVAAAARGQSSPMDVATQMAQGGASLDGDWKNVNPQASGLSRIVVNGTQIHPFGACHPTACDWGLIDAQGFASKVEKRDTFALLASQDQHFAKVVMTVSLETDGRLRVQAFTHFTDQSRRADYSHVDYFSR